MSPLDLASDVCARVLALGADEVSVTASRGTHMTLIRRDGRVEQATEATTRGLVVSLLAHDRFTSNSTSDLRPDALAAFLRRSVESARYLEPDPDRRLPPGGLCGRGASEAELDHHDPSWSARTAQDRAADAETLEAAFDPLRGTDVISTAVHVSDGASEVARVMSNGFSGTSRGTWFALAGETTLREEGKRPEASADFVATHRGDLPPFTEVADETMRRARERMGSGPIPSCTVPLILINRSGGRLLGIFARAMGGAALHLGQSFLHDKLEQRIASPVLDIVDDPTVPRGLGSRPWDGDGLVARPRRVIEDGVLRSFDINVYYGRKLDKAPTSGGRSNWIVRAGDQPWQAIASAWPRAVLVTSFLGGNSNPTTGDFSFGIRGALVEQGVITRSLAEMNVSGNALSLFERLVAVGDDPWPWSSVRCPTLMFDAVSFSGT